MGLMGKKLISVVMVFVLVLGLSPSPAFAESVSTGSSIQDSSEEPATVENAQVPALQDAKDSKSVSSIDASMALSSQVTAASSVDESIPATAAQSGSTSQSIQTNNVASGISGTCSWEITTDGELTIFPANGTNGVLDDIAAASAPWYMAVDQKTSKSITKVVVNAGVKAGKDASLFYGLENIESVDLTGLDVSNTTSMDGMFANCHKLNSVTLGSDFSFKGAGSTILMTFPTPSSAYIQGATGKWLLGDVAYTSDEVSNLTNVKGTYTAQIALAATPDVSIESATFDATTVYDGVDWSPVYDYAWYVNTYSDVATAFNGDPSATLAHFVNFGMNEGRQGCASFNVFSYRATYPDLQAAFTWTDLRAFYGHYVRNGRSEGRTASGTAPTSTTSGSFLTVYGGVDWSPVYNFPYYAGTYADVSAACSDRWGYPDPSATLAHFVNFGMNEGRQGCDSAIFNVLVYRASYTDLQAVFGWLNLKSYYRHYVEFGRAEGRTAIGNNPAVPIATASISQNEMSAQLSTNFPQNPIISLKFAVWSVAGGQDDLVWYEGARDNNGGWKASAPISNHKTAGPYIVHCYAVDKNGSEFFVGETSFSVTNLTGTLTVDEESVAKNNGKFDVTVSNIASKSGVSRVQVPVWVNSDQSDLCWYEASLQSDGTWKATVDIADHGFSNGPYNVHGYATGKNGVCNIIACTAQSVSVDTYMGVSRALGNGIREVGMKSAVPCSSVRFAVWSDANWQDDLVWYDAVNRGDGFWVANIDTKRLFDSGLCRVHCYYTNASGQSVMFDERDFIASDDEIGPSSNAELNANIRGIVASHPSLYDCYWYIVNSYSYIDMPHWPSYNGWQENYALQMLRNGGGNCYAFACLTYWCAKRLGYNCAVIEGYLRDNSGYDWDHGWVEVYADGGTYVVDSEMQRAAPGYNFYWVTYDNAPVTYIK